MTGRQAVINNGVERIVEKLGQVAPGKKTVLVTGGAGFVGSWVCETLVGLGSNVICLDNFSSGLKDNLSGLTGLPNFRFVEADVSQPLPSMGRIDLVMHLASRASPFEFTRFPLEILKANTLGTMMALEVARENRARFLYASSSETYGEPSVVPTPETYRGNVSAVGIRGCYDEGKRCGEALAMAYHRQHGLDVRMARIFNTYGPRMRADGIYGRVVPRFITQAMAGKPMTIFGDGSQTRSFCYVTDQVEALLRLATVDGAAGKVVNTGNDRETNVLELSREINSLLKSAVPVTFDPLPPDDPTRRCPDITLARALLGWTPRTALHDGLKATIEWFAAKPA